MMKDTPLDVLRFGEPKTVRHIAEAARAVDRNNAHIGVLSTGEQCAVALISDRPDFAKKWYVTLLECAIRVGLQFAAALFVQANSRTEAELDLA